MKDVTKILLFLWEVCAPFFRRTQSILVVEDSPQESRLIELAAKDEGVTVTLARDASEALGILTRNGKRFLIVVIDVNLPGMSGWTLRRELLDRWPRLRTCMMSGVAESFFSMPSGEAVTVLIKTTNYHRFFREVLN